MKLRMTMVTAIAGLSLVGLGGCAPSDSEGPASTDAPTSSAAPTEPTEDTAGIAGDWADPKAEWVVHFNADGTFVEDFQGVTDFRTGEYTVDDTTVSLVGGDGNTDKGTIKGDTLVFRLGTLTKK